MPRRTDQPSPPLSGVPHPRDWWRLLYFALRAAAELVRARIVFARIGVKDIQALNARFSGAPVPPDTALLLDWIAYTIPRAAHRMPFRADCMVQALAAQNWLAARGIGSAIVIGAERPEDKPFAAHAWLTCGQRVVTGGEIGRYTELI